MLLPHLEKENHRGTDADIYVLLRREAFPPNAPKRSSGEAVMNEGLVHLTEEESNLLFEVLESWKRHLAQLDLDGRERDDEKYHK